MYEAAYPGHCANKAQGLPKVMGNFRCLSPPLSKVDASSKHYITIGLSSDVGVGGWNHSTQQGKQASDTQVSRDWRRLQDWNGGKVGDIRCLYSASTTFPLTRNL